MARLIVNADDFGLTSGVNRAIRELHSAGLVTSATLMARAAATDEAIEIALATPSLGVGCHVVLTDGAPILSPDRIPSLVDRQTGQFHSKLSVFIGRLVTGRIRSAEIEAEAAAQIEHLTRRGVRLTHVDTHKHTHMFPHVLGAVLRAACAAGVRAVRNPFEPGWAVRAAHDPPWARAAQVGLLRTLQPVCKRIVARHGAVTTDGTLAVVSTGTFDTAAVHALCAAIPPGTWELVTHPGYNDADLAQIRTRLRETRDVERQALRELDQFPALERVSFAALAPASAARNADSPGSRSSY